MLHNPYKIVQLFEEELAHYTAAPYAVSVNSCTNALFLACICCELSGKDVTIPKHTYLSPPQSIMHSVGQLFFYFIPLHAISQLQPFPIFF